MGEAFFREAFLEDLRTRNARGAVSHVRELCEDIVIFDRSGFVWAVRTERGKLRAGDNMKKHMLAEEWRYILDNSLKFSFERLVVDTKLGGMVVFCNMAASMRIMIGVIFHVSREAMLAQYPERAMSLTRLSPRMKQLSRKRVTLPEAELAVAQETADLAFRAFMTGGVKNRLIRSAPEATSYLIERACTVAEFVGCRLDARSARSSVPTFRDFNMDAYVSLLTCLVLFVWDTCADRTFQMKIGDMEGRPFPIFRCESDLGDVPLFANRRFGHPLLHLCDGICANRMMLFECSEREDGDGPHLRLCFLPTTKPMEKLGVKEPIKKLKYSDETESQ